MSDDLERALEQARNGAGAGGPRVIGQIVIRLVETAPGQTATQMDCSVVDELQARGLYQKGAVILEMILAQRAAQNSPQVLRAGPIPPGLMERARKHMRG